MALIQVDDSNFQKISNFTHVPPDQIQDTDLITGLHNGGNANFRIYDIVSKVMAGIDIDPGQDPGYDPGGDLGEEVTYSVIIDHSKSDPVKMVTYADDALALRPGWNNVKDKPIFKKIRPCVLKDGQVLYYLNPDNYAYKYNVDEGITYSQIQEALQTKAWYTKARFVDYRTDNGRVVTTVSIMNYTNNNRSSPTDGDDFPNYPNSSTFANANYTRAALVSVTVQFATYTNTRRTEWRFVIYNETTGAIAFPNSPSTPNNENYVDLFGHFCFTGCVPGTEYVNYNYANNESRKILWKHFETNMPMFNVTSQDDVTTAGTPVNDWLVHGNLHDTINVIGYGNTGGQAEAADITTPGNDVMVEFPERLGYKATWLDENRLKVSITNRQNAVGFDYSAFSYRNYNDCDKIYIGAYEGNINSDKLFSRHNTDPLAMSGYTMNFFRTAARARGDGYEQFWYGPLVVLQILYLVAFNTLDCQTAMAPGRTGSLTSANFTGRANTHGMCNELVSSLSNYNSVKCFGIENLWGNVCAYVEGIKSDASYNLYVYDFTSGGWINVGTGGRTSNFSTYLKKAMGGRTPFFPQPGGGSATTYYCDRVYVNKEGIIVHGGSYNFTKEYTGIFYCATDEESSNYSNYGARLMYFHRG